MSDKWQFIRVNDDLSIAKFLQGSPTVIMGIYKPLHLDKFFQFEVRDEQIPKDVVGSGTLGAMEVVFKTLTENCESLSLVAISDKILLSIQRKKKASFNIECKLAPVIGNEEKKLLFESVNYLMKNTVVSKYLRNYLCHLASEKDRAIEFLGNTAKDYGASNAILKWAPENSPNYRSLMKLNLNSLLEDSAPERYINSDVINIDELNGDIKSNTAVPIKSGNNDKFTESSDKKADDTWESNFADPDIDDDSLLNKFGLDTDLGPFIDAPKNEPNDASSDHESDSDSDTDVEYESPRKRKRF